MKDTASLGLKEPTDFFLYRHLLGGVGQEDLRGLSLGLKTYSQSLFLLILKNTALRDLHCGCISFNKQTIFARGQKLGPKITEPVVQDFGQKRAYIV